MVNEGVAPYSRLKLPVKCWLMSTVFVGCGDDGKRGVGTAGFTFVRGLTTAPHAREHHAATCDGHCSVG